MKKEFKDFFYSLPPEELEKILDCIDVPDKLDTETLNRIKAKTKEKCGLTKKKKIKPKLIMELM